MQTMVQANQTSNALLWVGRVMSGLVIAFMLFDGVMNRRNPANWLFGWGNCEPLSPERSNFYAHIVRALPGPAGLGRARGVPRS